jgi:hypothetical protein
MTVTECREEEHESILCYVSHNRLIVMYLPAFRWPNVPEVTTVESRRSDVYHSSS